MATHPRHRHLAVPGHDRSWTRAPGGPSAWSRRLPTAALAAAGLAIATYLAAFQVGAIGPPPEPFFGDGSRRVLTSSLSRALPVPDSAIGAVGYLADIGLALAGGSDRWRRRPWTVFAFGAVAAGMAAGSVVLVFIQIVLLGAACTLCLASAGISIAIALLAWREGEVAAAVEHARPRLESGEGLVDVLLGRDEPEGDRSWES